MLPKFVRYSQAHGRNKLMFIFGEMIATWCCT